MSDNFLETEFALDLALQVYLLLRQLFLRRLKRSASSRKRAMSIEAPVIPMTLRSESKSGSTVTSNEYLVPLCGITTSARIPLPVSSTRRFRSTNDRARSAPMISSSLLPMISFCQ